GGRPTRSGVEIDVVSAGSPHRDELERGTGREHGVGEARMGADVDCDARRIEPAYELRLLIGAPLAEDTNLTQVRTAFFRWRAGEYGREVVGDDDHWRACSHWTISVRAQQITRPDGCWAYSSSTRLARRSSTAR